MFDKIFSERRLGSIIVDEGCSTLTTTISLQHGEQFGSLRLHHRDPFDRILIAQTQLEGHTIIAAESGFPKYDINLINALNTSTYNRLVLPVTVHNLATLVFI